MSNKQKILRRKTRIKTIIWLFFLGFLFVFVLYTLAFGFVIPFNVIKLDILKISKEGALSVKDTIPSHSGGSGSEVKIKYSINPALSIADFLLYQHLPEYRLFVEHPLWQQTDALIYRNFACIPLNIPRANIRYLCVYVPFNMLNLDNESILNSLKQKANCVIQFNQLQNKFILECL